MSDTPPLPTLAQMDMADMGLAEPADVMAGLVCSTDEGKLLAAMCAKIGRMTATIKSLAPSEGVETSEIAGLLPGTSALVEQLQAAEAALAAERARADLLAEALRMYAGEDGWSFSHWLYQVRSIGAKPALAALAHPAPASAPAAADDAVRVARLRALEEAADLISDWGGHASGAEAYLRKVASGEIDPYAAQPEAAHGR